MGQTITAAGKVLMHIEAGFEREQRELEVKVIRNGKVVKTSRLQTPFLITYYDEKPLEGRSYYRLEIVGKDIQAVTNPIFVER